MALMSVELGQHRVVGKAVSGAQVLGPRPRSPHNWPSSEYSSHDLSWKLATRGREPSFPGAQGASPTDKAVRVCPVPPSARRDVGFSGEMPLCGVMCEQSAPAFQEAFHTGVRASSGP